MGIHKAEKKSEKLEVRLTHTEKQALQEEARSKSLSVSTLVRDVLKRHIDTQSHLSAALQPLKRHPKSSGAICAAIASGLGFALITLPIAQADGMHVEMLGKMESHDPNVRRISRFSAKVSLNTDGEGTHLLIHDDQPFYVPSAKAQPYKIEITTAEAENVSDGDFLLTLRIIEQNGDTEIIAQEPSATLSKGRMTNFDLSSASGIRYTISAQITAD